MEIKKAIIPVAGLGTRFLPLSSVVPKELWPIIDKPLVHYIVEEAKKAGIKKIIFIVAPDQKLVLEYFKSHDRIEKILKERKNNNLISELKDFKEFLKGISFSQVVQKKPLGDGHAILQAARLINKEACVCMFVDDIIESEIPSAVQLARVFKTCQKPVLSLHRMPKDKISCYGVVQAEKISDRLYKIKRIVEKPKPEEAPSDLAIVGRYILTPEVFGYFKKPNIKGEIILADALQEMIKEGKVIYGYEIKGKWLECGNKDNWLKTNIYLSQKNHV